MDGGWRLWDVLQVGGVSGLTCPDEALPADQPIDSPTPLPPTRQVGGASEPHRVIYGKRGQADITPSDAASL